MAATSQSKRPLRCASESAVTPIRSSLKRSKSFANLSDLDSLGGASSTCLETPKRRAGSLRLPSDRSLAGASAFLLPIRKSSTHPEIATGDLEIFCGPSYEEEDCVATDAATSDSEASAGSRDGSGLYCFSSCAESDGDGWQSELEAEDAPAYDDDDEESDAVLRAPCQWPREDSWTLSSEIYAASLLNAVAAPPLLPTVASGSASANERWACGTAVAYTAAPLAKLPTQRQQQPLFEFGRANELAQFCERFRRISWAVEIC